VLLAHLRFALRALARRPGFAAVAVLTLAIGIGGTSAVFSVARGVLLRPLPFRDPDRLVLVYESNLVRDRPRNVVNPGNYLEWRDRNTSFEGIAAFLSSGATLDDPSGPLRLDTGAVTSNFFDVLGVAPTIGRAFLAEDARPGSPAAIVLSDALFRRRFGADPSVLGRAVTVNGAPATIVGVMPAALALPAGAEMWRVLREGEGGLQRGARGRSLLAVARLKPGVDAGTARAEMVAIAAATERLRPDFNTGWSASVFPLHADLVRDYRPAVLVQGGAVALLLLIACGNLANLLLARSLAREREMAVRRALGADRGRIVGQLLVESLVLAVAGGGLGLVFAAWGAQGLAALLPPETRLLFPITLDGAVVAVTFGLCVLSAVLSGLLPALHLARPDLSASLRQGSAGGGTSRERRRVARLVVSAEIALSVLLLAGAGLLLRSFWRLSSVDAGFRPEGVLSAQVPLTGPAYAEGPAQARFFTNVTERLAASPGVQAAAAMSARPLAIGSATSFAVLDRPAPARGQEPTADVRFVTPGLFRTLGIALRDGRDFDGRDVLGRPDVVIVNERAARDLWPGESPLGKRIRMEWFREVQAEVVGVVADVRITSLDTAARAQLYWPQAQIPGGFMVLFARGDGTGDVAGALRAAVAASDPGIPVARVATLDDVVGESLRRPRFTFVLLAALAGTAALLAALGLFGVLAYSIGQRLPEMGVRVALGATPGDIMRLVLGEGARLYGLGLAVGLAAALTLAPFLRELLYEIGPRDPWPYATVVLLVAAIGLAATWWPARRASRVAPAAALRTE
jgi:putative ABC transport system permease protein